MNDYGNRTNGNRGGYSGKPVSGAPKKPATPKGHDAVLKALQDDGREITIIMQSGDNIIGTVVARDKFTISVRETLDEAMAGSPARTHVVYKHAIESFFAQAKSAVTE
jgi:sRNA-binding regulator protein Hfq